MRKKLIRQISLLTILSMIISRTSVFAQTDFITFTGVVDDANAVSVMILKKDTCIHAMRPDDFLYLSQEDVNDDGTFSIKIPIMQEADYDMYSNALDNVHVGKKTKTIYVSSDGDDNNSGESIAEPLKTLSAAYDMLCCTKEIVLLSDYTYTDIPSSYTGDLTIRGDDSTIKLIMPYNAVVNLKGNVKIDNCVISGDGTIYANGYNLEIGSGVTSDKRLIVYGGTNGVQLTGDTNIKIYGGQYSLIFGGCNNGAALYGNTNVAVGGNVNPDEVLDSDTACYVYGGGNGSPVYGATNVTFGGNAITNFVFGAGRNENGTAYETNISIIGGNVMNVYGGSNSAALNNCNTHIVMTGGVAEALFGGSNRASLTGNTCVDVFGGKVTRRIYTGCYNNMTYYLLGASWDSDNYVKGTTTLRLKPGVSVVTGNDENRGLFCGSRTKSKHDDESNILICLDGSYNTYENYMGEQGSFAVSHLKNYLDYAVSATTGGDVYTIGSNTVYAQADRGYYTEYDNNELELSDKTTIVNFYKDFNISSLESTMLATGLAADIKYTTDNHRYPDKASKMLVAVYESGRLVNCSVQQLDTKSEELTVNIGCTLESGKSYTVTAMMWDNENRPLTATYNLSLQK